MFYIFFWFNLVVYANYHQHTVQILLLFCLCCFFSLLCCWTLNLSHFSGAHLFVNVCLSTQNSLSIFVTPSQISLLSLSRCIGLRACVRMHVQLCILLFSADNATCCTNCFSCIGFFDGILSLSFSLPLSHLMRSRAQMSLSVCVFLRSKTEMFECVRAYVLCVSFDFSLMQSTLLEKHTTLRWTTRYS